MAESTLRSARVAEDTELRSEYEELQKKYKLVSDLLTAKPNEHVEFKKFENLLNGEFREFADAESSLAEEAAAVQRLERLAERLKELVVFPHLSAKLSIAIGGGFSSGKSAFVNSFIEGYDHLLPERVEPATAIPSFVIANSEMAIKGFSRTGYTVDIDPVLYSQLSHSFIDTFSFNLKDIMPSITVEVPLHGNLFENICLIDTPGYNPGGRNEDRTTAADFLKDRDALIWMIGLDSTGTVPEEDLEFLENLELGSLPFYVVLNKADIKPRSELEDILNEVKDTLADADFEPLGISVYSSRRSEEFSYDEMSLADFFCEQNQPKEANTDLKQEIEGVFEMYVNAILKDERTAKWMTNELKAIDFHLSELNPDDADVLGEKISKLIDSQKRDFAPIKKQMGQIRQKMLSAIDEIFQSLNFAKPELTAREAAEESEEREFIAKVGRKPSPDIVYNKGVTDLHHAVCLNLPALAQSLLDQGADIDAKATLHASILTHLTTFLDKTEVGDDEREIEDSTPLHAAALANARQTAEVLLQNGADINAKDDEGGTSLHFAALANARETAEVLLQNGADINAKDDEGATSLHFAALANARQTAEVLLQNGADINAKAEGGVTPLDYAALANAWQTAEVLLQNGAEVNAKNDNGVTSLHAAASTNARETAEVLLQNGADINAKATLHTSISPYYTTFLDKMEVEDDERELEDSTPLHAAALADARETAEVLLQNGADINAKAKGGVTPLDYAALANAWQTAEVLFQNGADINAQADNGTTPLHDAAWTNARETAEVLLQNGADINAQADNGTTPLHDAAWTNARETAEVLLQNGADINAQAENGTPLHFAALADARETAEVLFQNGADINAQAKNGRTSLHDAAWTNAWQTAEVLLQNGADINAQAKNGRTSLHDAALVNARETAEVLLKWGTDVNAEDSTGLFGGKKPLHYAAEKGNSETAELLSRYGGQR